ncbi:CinA family protein [Roseibium sp. H3510]|uniref:CinA family protein n=2 Tax=Roseibium algae TaxID=3123038 RepID=A0ABU8TT95_9HYPH
MAEEVIAAARYKNAMIATAESCTGGLIAGLLTEVPGSSAVVDRGFVTYSNEAKQEMLGVPLETLQAFGAVSPQTAIAMAEGALERSHAHIAISVTGIAGPGGGTKDKPVGTVHFAIAVKGQVTTHHPAAFGHETRDQIRYNAIGKSLKIVLNAIDSVF